MTQVKALELQYHDDYANSHKYYRLYMLPTSYLAQWGRVGTTGQFKLTKSNSPIYDAKQQAYSKESKGYEYTVELVFDLNESWVTPENRTQQMTLDSLFSAARKRPQLGAVRQTAPAAEVMKQAQRDAEDTKRKLEEEKLKATLLKITRRAEPESATPTGEPDNSMEAKLAAAMAKAKEEAR